MNIERPGSPSATTVTPASTRRSTSIETRRSRLASETPPKNGVASKNAFRSGEPTAMELLYPRSLRRQAGPSRRDISRLMVVRAADTGSGLPLRPRLSYGDLIPIGSKIMSRFWSPVVHSLSPYVPGEQPRQDGIVKLNTNENPYPPSPRVLAAIASATDRLRLYPDPHASALRETIAVHYGVAPEEVFVGNGS